MNTGITLTFNKIIQPLLVLFILNPRTDPHNKVVDYLGKTKPKQYSAVKYDKNDVTLSY